MVAIYNNQRKPATTPVRAPEPEIEDQVFPCLNKGCRGVIRWDDDACNMGCTSWDGEERELRGEELRVCSRLGCSKEYSGNAKTMYCSDQCSAIARNRQALARMSHLKVCHHAPCSLEFRGPGNAKYCSRDCLKAEYVAQRQNITPKNCAHCGKKFRGGLRAIYCGLKCRTNASNLRRNVRRIRNYTTRVCAYEACGKQFTASGKHRYCTEVCGRMESNRRKAIKWREQRGKLCQQS